MKRKLLLLTAFLLVSSVAHAWTVDSLTFTKRKAVTIDNANVDATLTDFPVLVKITDDTDLGAVMQADGDDIRFTTSDGTLCTKEKESFAIATGAATGIWWVKVPSVSTSADTTIYAYYGNVDAAAQTGTPWDANFKSVYHLTGNYNGTAGEVKDSIGNYNLKAGNGNSSRCPAQVTGQINYGQNFADNSNAFIGYGPSTQTDLRGVGRSVSFWGKKANWVGEYNCTITAVQNGYAVQSGSDIAGGTKKIYFMGDGSNAKSAAFTASDSTWHHFAGTIGTDNLVAKIYVDGVSKTPLVTGNYTGSPYGLCIGAADYASTARWVGSIDEMRISNSVRSDAWFKFEYANMSEADNEIAWGEEETDGDTAPTGNFFLFL